MNASMRLSPEQFVKTLENISTDGGKKYRRLDTIRQAELDHGELIAAFRGHTALSGAAECFILETVECLNRQVRPKVKTPISEFFPQFVERIGQYFRSLRAANLLATQGYPFHGYVLLRNIFDGAVLTAAAATGLTDFYRLEGIDPNAPFDPTSFRRNRRNEERRVRALMTGESSGLTDATKSQRDHWDILFDDETHGGHLTRSHSVGWMKGHEPLPFVPTYHRDAVAMFMNRHNEVAWMVHRLLPLLQPQGISLSAEWKSKWKTLDACFRQAVSGLTTELGKPIGKAMTDFVTSKFSFDADSVFWA
jgi:hypothetical protein